MAVDRLLLSLVLLGGIILLFSFFLHPHWQEYDLLKKERLKKEKELASKAEYFFRIESILKDLERRKESLEKIDLIIPSKISFADLLNFLNEKANENGILINSLNYLKTTEFEKGIKENYFSIDLNSSYQGFKNFIKELENSARLIEIEKISISSTKQEKIKHFIITFKVFSL